MFIREKQTKRNKVKKLNKSWSAILAKNETNTGIYYHLMGYSHLPRIVGIEKNVKRA